MRHSNITKAALLSAGLLGGLFSGEAGAQSRALTQRTSTLVTGNINYVTTGASFRRDAGNTGSPSACEMKQPAYSSSYPGYTRTSGAVSPARITANTVPSGATVKAAYLYWVASAGESGFNNNQPFATSSVKFYVSGAAAPSSTNVSAQQTWTASTTSTKSDGSTVTQYGMGAIADVTSIVKANPNAQYRMDELWVFNGAASTTSYYSNYTCYTNTAYANWALYIVYDLPGESTKTFSLYDGLSFVGGDSGTTSSS
ncbi:MAG: hypothetical protein Q4C67_06560, partial [Deinococcus sp.]|nr:hypothetical protein [Deinococcus sp.]